MSALFTIGPVIDKLMMLQEDVVTTFAIESGFMRRKPRKIDPKTFLLAFCIMVLQGGKSLSSLAMAVGMLKGIRVSKQAIDQRVNEACVRYLERVLAHAIAQKINTCCPRVSSVFSRVLLHDSTTVRVPSQLADEFPGSSNGKGKDISLVKIQTVYDALRERFCYFWISPFTTNDQKIATTMLEYVHQGDLVIRDLGYFVLRALALIQHKGAFFITRLRHGIVLYDLHSEKRVNLFRMLKRHRRLDMTVIVGTEEKLTVRLVALPVDPAIAAHRRRILRANRDRRLNPSKEHLALLGWNLFLLNTDVDTLPAEDVVALYGLRWRIETIFKAWKSNFHLAALPRASAVHLRAYLYAFFLFVTLFHAVIFSQYNTRSLSKYNRPLSLLKLSRIFREQFWAITLYISRPAALFDQISYHALYEKRDDRLNYHQKVAALT
ncbi:MAG: IS4 family transposase [Ignavibacteria bacterium]|nr:IS4 family transposase [Ignavibacteria bacterium]